MSLVPPVGPRDHVLGPEDAAVTLVEYGDYQCGFCGQAHEVLKAVLDELEGVRYVFRHFPLTQAHPAAELAAQAAEAAGAQGRFWQMHDALFENQAALEPEDLLAYATSLGLDRRRFAADLERGVHAARVRDDFRSGLRSGVNGTPSFFIDGERHDGGWDEASLVDALQRASRHARVR
jgi:protein-disulfide isomerase